MLPRETQVNMKRVIRLFAIGLFAVAASAASFSHPLAQSASSAALRVTPNRATPKLVVLIVADQFRADYIQRYGGMWTKGLRRLVDHGAYFPLAAYPYSYTVTCAGHSTIGTGAFPHTHGMVGNEWYDRATRRTTTCTNDPSVTSVPYGGRPGVEKHSARWMTTTTFADELRAQSTTPAHVVSVSLKARAAIGMAGHGGDLVVWEEDAATWASSSAFATAPNAALNTWTTAHPIAAQYGRVWNRLLPASRYFFADNGVGEPSSPDNPNVFPHRQVRPSGQPDQSFYDNWERTPFSDEMLADIAITASRSLGRGSGTDMLAVSFSALDLVGHRWGPASHEVQDTLLRLDVQIGRLLDRLDARVGAGNYVVGFSADHGASPIPEQMTAMGLDAGRFSTSALNARVVDAWKAATSDTASPIASGGANMYFTPAAMTTIRSSRSVRDAITAAALSSPGIAYAYWSDDLAAGAGDDPVKRAVILGYMADRSPDLTLIPKQYWMSAATGTTHGTPNLYDQRVPLILMGWGIKPGRYLTSATPADLAPTFAQLTGITLPRAEGRVLGEAIRDARR
jgi:predicted AlkP superfamily pyrophosphatase or phosphodiesterase